MEIAKNIVMVLHIIACVVLIAVVLLQSGKSAGLSGTIAGGAETFFGKNKGRTIDAILGKWTVAFAVVFLATSVALSVIVMSLTSAPATDAGNTLTDEQMQQLMDSMQVETETDAPAETEAEAPAAE
ncbi:MAG: preprotein translocase subunit SecG [Clostridia bacterium]|nr:preprotein translocase subunit SecG [Clostridia bacterium]